jgi:hypothetical protein
MKHVGLTVTFMCLVLGAWSCSETSSSVSRDEYCADVCDLYAACGRACPSDACPVPIDAGQVAQRFDGCIKGISNELPGNHCNDLSQEVLGCGSCTIVKLATGDESLCTAGWPAGP